MSGMIPIFSRVIGDKVEKVLPVVKDRENRRGNETKLVQDLAKQIEEKASNLLAGEDGGTNTIAGYILMETLLRLGLHDQVEQIKSNKNILTQASTYCAIGMLAGMEIPSGTRFEEEYASGGADVWKGDDAEDSGKD